MSIIPFSYASRGCQILKNYLSVGIFMDCSYNLKNTGGESEGKRPKWLRQLEGGQQAGKEVDKMSDERRYGIR